MNAASDPAGAFRAWLANPDGDRALVYWEGDLAIDADASRTARALREAAAEAAEAGLVHLTQRRLGSGLFAYVATKAAATRRAA